MVQGYLARAYQEQPGTVPMMGVYRLVGARCGNTGDTPAEEKAYKGWYKDDPDIEWKKEDGKLKIDYGKETVITGWAK